MVAVLCSNLPDKFTADEAVKDALSLFRAEANRDYFETLKKNKNSDSIKESFFAINLLAEAIDMLPCRCDKDSLVLKKTDSGKPYFVCSDIRFSISHSKGRVAVAVSDSEDIGIDIECAEISSEKAKNLAKRFFSETEALAVDNNPEIFKQLWCEKEAETKLWGGELSTYLKSLKDENNKDQIIFQRFFWNKHPVILCSKQNFSTIVFKIHS